MTVDAPAFYALMPHRRSLVVEGGMVYDAMSGASPLYFNTLSGASIFDYRTAGDIKVTKYFDDYAVSVRRLRVVGAGFPVARRFVNVQIYSDDRNRTWACWASPAPTTASTRSTAVAPNSTRNSLEFLVGVTQALSPIPIVQSNLTYYTGHGYYSDPYKSLDTRPSARAIRWRGSRVTTISSPTPTPRSSSATACCSIRSAARRTCSRRPGRRRCRTGSR